MLIEVSDIGNSRDQAAVLPSSSETILANVGHSGDPADWFRISTDASGQASFSLSGLSQDVDIELLDSRGTWISGSYEYGTRNESLDAQLDANSTYYLTVYGYDNALSSYRLTYDLPVNSPPNDSPTSGLEGPTPEVPRETPQETPPAPVTIEGNGGIDAGNSFSSATTIEARSTVINGSTGRSGDSNDYFKFVASASGEAEFKLEKLSEDLDLRLYNSDRSLLKKSTNGNDSSESIKYELTAGETYYLKVDPYFFADSDYELSLRFSGETVNYEQRILLDELSEEFTTDRTNVAYDTTVVDANLYEDGHPNAFLNGQCVSYVKNARSELDFAWGNAVGGARAADRQGFHIDDLPAIGSAFVLGTGRFGHTGIVTDVHLVRTGDVNNDGVQQYRYEFISRESNRTNNTEMDLAFSREMSLPNRDWDFIWGTDAEYTSDRNEHLFVVERLQGSDLLGDMNGADDELIAAMFMLNTQAKFDNFLKVIEINYAVRGKAVDVDDLVSQNLLNDVLAKAQLADYGESNLVGTNGDDILISWGGVDTLEGGQGSDTFKFILPDQDQAVALSGSVIRDFRSGTDTIEVVGDMFDQLGFGSLERHELAVASSSLGSDPVFVYDNNSGLLSFDVDGAGGIEAVEIVTLIGSPSLSAGDITIVAL